MNRKTIWMIVLTLLILTCSIWSSFKIETFNDNDYDFYPSEIKTDYRDILNSKYNSAYNTDTPDLLYMSRLINNNNLLNSSQTNFLDIMSDKMNSMEHNLMGIMEKPKYYSGNQSGSITKDDPKGLLRPGKETLKTSDHYEN
jgi:hypothetical protein